MFRIWMAVRPCECASALSGCWVGRKSWSRCYIHSAFCHLSCAKERADFDSRAVPHCQSFGSRPDRLESWLWCSQASSSATAKCFCNRDWGHDQRLMMLCCYGASMAIAAATGADVEETMTARALQLPLRPLPLAEKMTPVTGRKNNEAAAAAVVAESADEQQWWQIRKREMRWRQRLYWSYWVTAELGAMLLRASDPQHPVACPGRTGPADATVGDVSWRTRRYSPLQTEFHLRCWTQ